MLGKSIIGSLGSGGCAFAFWLAVASCSDATDLKHVPPTFDAVQDAARQVITAHCATPECRAIVTIADVLKIDLDAAASTVGTPRPILLDRQEDARSALNTTVLNHPGDFDAICESSKDIVSGYSKAGRSGEVFVPVSLLRLGLAMDYRGGGNCLSAMLARLPKTASAEVAIHNARILCINEGGNVGANCDALAR